MDEIRRFLRYTLPGLAVTLIGFGALRLLESIPDSWMGGDGLLAKFAGIFVASGALGYLLANLYFAIRWVPPFDRYLVIDHKRVITALGEVLDIRGPSDKAWNLNRLTLFDAWSILNNYCVSQPETNCRMRNIVAHTKMMVDVTHGLGALCTGVTLVTLVGLVLKCLELIPPASPQSLMDIHTLLVLLMLLSCILWVAFRKSLRALESISNAAFVTSIRAEYKKINYLRRNNEEKFVIYYERDDELTQGSGQSLFLAFWIVVPVVAVLFLIFPSAMPTTPDRIFDVTAAFTVGIVPMTLLWYRWKPISNLLEED
jgi:hypothetical protein